MPEPSSSRTADPARLEQAGRHRPPYRCSRLTNGEHERQHAAARRHPGPTLMYTRLELAGANG